MKYFSILFMLVGLLFVSSCKKDDATPARTKSDMIMRTWKISEVYVDGQKDDDPMYSAMRLTFKSGGIYETQFAGSTDSGTWEFNSDQTKVILDKGTSDSYTMDVVELNDSRFKVKYSDDGEVNEWTMIPA